MKQLILSLFSVIIFSFICNGQSDAKVDAVYTLGKIPSPILGYNHYVQAKIINKGSIPFGTLPVSLNISGANTFTDTITIMLAAHDSTIVSFAGTSLWNTGNNTITVTVPADDDNTNNSASYTQNVNSDTFSYADNSPVAGKRGFGTGSGMLLISVPQDGTSTNAIITQVRVHISNDIANIDNLIYGVVVDGGSVLSQSVADTIHAADLGNYMTFNLPDPVTITNFSGHLYVGILQTANAATPYYPLSYQQEGATSTRPYTYYSASEDVSSFNEIADSGRLMIEAIVGINYYGYTLPPNIHAYNAPDHILAAWDFSNSNSPQSIQATLVDTSLAYTPVLSRGADASPYPSVNYFYTKGFGNDGIDVSHNDYFEFSFAPKPGDTLMLKGIGTVTHGKYFAGQVSTQLAYSINNGSFTLINNSTAISSIPELQHIAGGTQVTFRYYVTGIQDTGYFGLTSYSPGSYGLTIYGSIVTSNTIRIAPLPPTGADFTIPNCGGASGTIPFVSTGTFGPNNKYLLQLGTLISWQGVDREFEGPYLIIDSLVSNTNSGTINFTMPAISGEEFLLRIISTDPYIEGTSFCSPFNASSPGCVSPYPPSSFRTRASGDWSDINIWEYFNGLAWIPSTSIPDLNASTISISHDDIVTVTTNVSSKNLIIQGYLKVINDGATNNGSMYTDGAYGYHGREKSVFIDTAGVLQVISSLDFEDVFLRAVFEVQVAGKILIGDGLTTIGDGYDIFGLADWNYWSNGSVFEWNVPSGRQLRTDTLYFPNVVSIGAGTQTLLRSPILRITRIPDPDNLGGTNNTTINGILEANTPITWRGAGTKTFKDGVQGSSIITQDATSGEFITTESFELFPATDTTVAAFKGVINGTVNVELNNTTGYTLIKGAAVPDTADVHISGMTRSTDTIQVFAGGRMTVDAASTLDMNNAGLINRGTLAGPGIIQFTGTDSSFLNSPGNITAPIILINKELYLAGNSNTASIDITNHSHLKLDSFHLNMGSAPLNADSVNFIVTNDTGRLIRNVAAAEVKFPIGVDTSSYTPVTLTNSGIADNLKVRVAPGVSYVQPLDNGNVDRTWFIDSTTGGSNLLIKTQWNSANEQTGFDRLNSFIAQSHGCDPPPNCTDGFYYDNAARTAATIPAPYTQSRAGITGPTSFIVKSTADTSFFTGGANNGLWSDSTNWTIGIVPSTTIANGKIIVIDYPNPLSTAPCSVIGDIIIEPGGQLIIRNNCILTVTGNIINH